MRILHVVPTYLPARRYGGPIVAVHGLCKSLVERGHEIDVFTTTVDGNGVLDVSVDRPVIRDGVSVGYFPSSFRRLYWSPPMARALRKRVREYDLVHIHSVYLWPGAAAARAARRARVPYMISPRGMLVPELIRRKSRLIKTAWLALVERRSFAHATAIHFTSRLEWEDARRVGMPLPCPFVVPNGIDMDARPTVEREPRTLIYVGRVSWKKGLDVIVQALPRLCDVRLVIVGNDDEALTPRLQALAHRLGVDDRVQFVGPIYGPAKNELLARATLFVLMSSSENFGNAVLEALAMETPTVLSPQVGLAEEVVRAGAGIVGLAGIPALLADPVRRAEMGRRGRELVESRFSWSKVAARMEESYQCSIASRR